jgi:hypothetical protein
VSVIAGQCGNLIYKEGDVKTAELFTTVAGNSTIDMTHANIMSYAKEGYADG